MLSQEIAHLEQERHLPDQSFSQVLDLDIPWVCLTIIRMMGASKEPSFQFL